jgi:DNA segregation ATPase FtsK/SpoIIIE, S-DNA-T family
MSRIAWHRPARTAAPELPTDQVPISAPPQVQAPTGAATWLTTLLPMLSSISIAAYMITYHQALLIFLALGIVTLSVGLTFGIRWQTRATARRAKERQRTRYTDHLVSIRQTARAVAATQREVAAWQWPSPQRLWAIAERRRRVWERRPADPDFLRLRIGLGRGPLSTPLQINSRIDPTSEYDPELMGAARRVIDTCGTVGKQPTVIDLAQAGVVSLVGPAELTRASCRALLSQLAVLHAPDDVMLMVSTGGADAEWEWTSWLPHTRDPRATDSAGSSLVASGYDNLADVVERELARAQSERGERRGRPRPGRDLGPSRGIVIVVDSFHPDSPWARSPLARRLVETAGPETGVSVIALVDDAAHEPSRVGVRVVIDPAGALAFQAREPRLVDTVAEPVADLPSVELVEATARALAPLLLTEEHEEALARTVPLAELLGVSDLENFDPESTWVGPGDDEVLCAAIGVAGDADRLVLDLKESAQGGMGPHGLIVGATGSGKSELLRTLLTGLTMTHPADLLSLVLVDFKGGATFAGMTDLPHVAGLITNLADDLALVDRVRDALVGEQQRRQRMLRDAGNVDSLREYQAKQAAGESDVHGRPLEPLPYLLVVVDEFGELLSARPEFINLFVQIGRVGRSLGIHLLLATQRLEEGRLRGLESHLSYRICLRTFSAAESRAVIGTTDAYHLPNLPGSAYLKVSESHYERFRVAHVSAPYYGPGSRLDLGEPTPPEPVPLGLRVPPDPEAPDPVAAVRPAPSFRGGPTQMRVIVERLCRFGQPVHQVWLPPLPPAIPLDALLGPLTVQDGRGLQASMWPFRGGLRFPTGIIDLPLRQEQQPLVLDFAQMAPHLLLVGASQSGKSTFLRTLMLSAMLTHSPLETRFSCLDYGGGSLHPLGAAPHVSGVAVRGETERVWRVLNETRRLIVEREQLFRDLGIDSMADFRRMRDAGQLDGSISAADVFLVVDNWGGLRTELPDVDQPALDIAARGPGVGVHLVMTANRWGDVRMNLRDAISARLELRLNDPSESEVNRQVARSLPAGAPGRGVSPPGLHYQALLPRLDGRDTTQDLSEAQGEVLDKISASWQGVSAPPIRLLPGLVHARELAPIDPATAPPGAVVGIGERDLEPVHLDLSRDDQHCLVVGDGGAGKSIFLRTWMAGLAARHDPQQVRFMIVDYRRALLDAVPAPYVGA